MDQARNCIDCDRPAHWSATHCCHRCYEVTEQGHNSTGARPWHTDDCNARRDAERVEVRAKLPSPPPPNPPQLSDDDKHEVDLALKALSLCFNDAKGKTRPHRGQIECPKCKGVLHYVAKTSAAGTIWARCSTQGCLQWMV